MEQGGGGDGCCVTRIRVECFANPEFVPVVAAK